MELTKRQEDEVRAKLLEMGFEEVEQLSVVFLNLGGKKIFVKKLQDNESTPFEKKLNSVISKILGVKHTQESEFAHRIEGIDVPGLREP